MPAEDYRIVNYQGETVYDSEVERRHEAWGQR
jgi:hypothetical protein